MDKDEDNKLDSREILKRLVGGIIYRAYHPVTPEEKKIDRIFRKIAKKQEEKED